METTTSWVDFTLTRGPIRGSDRNRIGLVLRIKARPEVEQYMSALAKGNYSPVDAHGDGWYNCNPKGNPLEVYDTEVAIDAANKSYTLSAVSQALITTPEDRQGRLNIAAGHRDAQINLSFLKLVGISSEEGVTVGLAGAYSADYVNKVRNLLGPTVRQFLQDYLVPITINLSIVSK
jgi:hypothetical protein